ncbi:MAG TPA: CDP-alcohol phosphatidyltransferase family protein [Nocardioidaceae bacterium]|nr:CDP-alcohol phosphatidyltransferase family protein [Nocardioidaceae bacterium]
MPVFTRARLRTAGGIALTALAVLVVWFALVAPNKITHLSLGAFVRIPLEGVLIGAALVLLPAKARKFAAGGVGALLGLLTVLKLLDMGFYEALDRPFDPVTDRAYFGPAVGLLDDSVGHRTAVVVVTIGIVAAVVIPVATALAVVRLSRLGAEHKTGTLRGVAAVGAAWALLAVFGAPLASSSAAGLAYDQIAAVHDAIEQQDVFAERAAHDAYANTPGNQLLTGLRGKDVIVAFVESYGQVAVEDSSISPGVDAVLDAGTASLSAAGFHSESGWLTSPTFGGISWLAHSTFQSGLWVDNQLLYNELMTSDRLTLATAFKRAGWSTVADVPSNEKDWPEGKRFYDYNRIYGDGDVGYEGPSFSYASMPDQYTLAAFHRLELARPHNPLFAEIDLVSSHTPWAPLPHLIGWNQVGDGEAFNSMAADGADPNDVWRSADGVKEAYGQSIEYSLSTLISFVQKYGDKNLVLIVLGDHQPAKIVTGEDPTHNVPIAVVAHDPAVMRKIASWGWDPGLRPSSDAPLWQMDSFRDRLFVAFGP